MAKWLFLAVIAVIFWAGNATFFDSQLSFVSKAIAAAAVNVFILSLILIWMSSYYQRFRSAGYGVFGHATVFLSGGIGFAGIGFHGMETGNCNSLIGHDRIPGALSKLAMWATENDVCYWLFFSCILFGLFMAWPSLNLFYGRVRGMK